MSTANTVEDTKIARVRYARRAARCAHVKYNGETCGCPALKGRQFCRFHVDGDAAEKVALPLLEDAAALQVAIMRIVRALEMDMLEPKKATAQLYALQLASSNLTRLRAELPIDEDESRSSLVMRLLRLINPPIAREGDVCSQLMQLLDSTR